MDRPTSSPASDLSDLTPRLRWILGLTLAAATLGLVLLLAAQTVLAGVNEPSWSDDTGDWVNDVAISSDGRYVASGSYNGQIYLFDLEDSEDGKVVVDYTAGGEIKDVDLSSDGRMLVAVSSDGYVYRFDRDNLPFPSTPVSANYTGKAMLTVDISDHITTGNKYYYVAGTSLENYYDDRIYFYTTENNRDGSSGYYRQEQSRYTTQAVISDDGMWAANIGGKYYHYWWNNTSEDNHGYHTYRSYWNTGTRNYFRSIDMDGEGKWVLIGKENGGVVSVARNGSIGLDTTVGSSGNHVNAVTLTPDDTYYLVGGKDGYIWLFNETYGRIFSNDTGNPVFSVAITPDGDQFAAGNQLRKVIYYYPDQTNPDGKGEDLMYWWYKTGGYVQSVAISDDGSWTAAGVSDEDDDNVFYFDEEGEPNPPPDAFIDHVTDEDGNDYVEAAFENTNVTFEGHGEDPDGRITAHYWESSLDGELSTKAKFKTDQLTLGDHTIYYKVKDDEGRWSTEQTWSMSIHNPPEAFIDDISPNPADEGETVDFQGHGEDDGSIEAYEWVSDKDGLLSDEASFSMSFNGAKTHTISLRVKDNNGAWSEKDSTYLDIHEKPNNPPTATIQSVSPDPAMVGQEVTLKGKGDDPDGNRIEAWEWTSSLDGDLGAQATVRAYLSEGTHTLTFRVRDQKGDWSEEDTYELEVEPQLVAIITLLQVEATEGDEVTISGASSQGNIAEWYFDFGDGTSPQWYTTDKVVHVFENEGTYQISLQVRNANGVETTEPAVRLISIKKQPEVTGDDDTPTGGGGDSPSVSVALVSLTLMGTAVLARRQRH